MSSKNSNLIIKGALSATLGLGILGGTYLYADQHEVKNPEDAAVPIMFGEEVVTYIDEPEIPVLALGLIGSLISGVVAIEAVSEHRRNSRE